MKFADKLAAETENSNAARVMERSLRSQLRLATSERDKLKAQLSLIESLEAHKSHAAPQWLTPKNPAKGHRATLCLLLTDTHLDEEVSPDEVDGMNAYNRHIAEMRLERFFMSSVKLAKHYLSGVKYDGAVLMLGGDIFSGNIHEELSRTNADTLFGSILYWLDPMRAADDFGRAAMMLTGLFADKLMAGQAFDPADVAKIQIVIKLSRSMHASKRDNWTDIAGYAETASWCEEG